MALGSDGLSSSALRQARSALRNASDEQLVRVVGLLDGLEARGSADALIAPLRDRVAQLQPARPLSFGRLLFTPVEPLLLPAPEWTRGALGVPRTALAPLAAQVRASLGERTTEIDAHIAGGRCDDADLVLSAGTRLWPAAAATLDRASAPAGWGEATGLGAADHAAIARTIACVLAEAVWIHTSMRACAEGVGPSAEDVLARLTAAVSGRHPDAEEPLLAVVLARFPGATGLIAPAAVRTTRSAQPIEAAVGFLLDRLEALPLSGAGAIETETAVQQAADLLDGLEAPGPGQRPSGKPRIERLRRVLDERCRARFADELAHHVLAPLAQGAAQGQIEALEETARRLRRLELAGRRLGGGEHYDRIVRAAVRDIGASMPGSLVERARLVEILAGPDAALALLQA